MVHVYHFAKAEHLTRILAEGLRPISRYHHLRSSIRQGAVFAWLTPGHDRMGYRDNPEYVCLRLAVSSERCLVSNMDLISAAWVNWIGAGGQPKNRTVAEELVQAYDETAVPIEQYQSGLFRAPEVVVFGVVEPAYITPSQPGAEESFEDNAQRYRERWERKLCSLMGLAYRVSFSDLVEALTRRRLIRRVAIHDDSGGWLATYALKHSNEFFTLRVGQRPLSPLSDGP